MAPLLQAGSPRQPEWASEGGFSPSLIGKATADAKEQHHRLLAWVYAEDGSRHSPTHRLASRPWLAETFEQLPTLESQKRESWRREVLQRRAAARSIFMRHLRETHGTEIRAWRRALDPQGKFRISLTTVRRYCRSVDLPVNVNNLWRSLDRDGTNVCKLEEFCARDAEALAAFQRWARESCGSCAALWARPELHEARLASVSESTAWASDKKVFCHVFEAALEALHWSASPSRKACLMNCLDVYGCGFISLSDLEWMDAWHPPEWLLAEPDHEGLEELRALVVQHHGSPLRAWRYCFSPDNPSKVSYREFKAGCARIRLSGSVAGIWRALDTNLSGAISIKEFDEPSSRLVASFRSWAISTFGSVALAFRAADTDRTGAVPYPDLKRICRQTGFSGNVRFLFEALVADNRSEDQDVLSKRRLMTVKDITFLDAWECDLGLDVSEEEDLMVQAPSSRASVSPLAAPPSPACPSTSKPGSAAGRRSPSGSGGRQLEKMQTAIAPPPASEIHRFGLRSCMDSAISTPMLDGPVMCPMDSVCSAVDAMLAAPQLLKPMPSAAGRSSAARSNEGRMSPSSRDAAAEQTPALRRPPSPASLPALPRTPPRTPPNAPSECPGRPAVAALDRGRATASSPALSLYVRHSGPSWIERAQRRACSRGGLAVPGVSNRRRCSSSSVGPAARPGTAGVA